MEYNVFWSSFPDIKLVIFPPFPQVAFYSVACFLCYAEDFFEFDVISLVSFYFCGCAFGVIFKKSFPRPITWFLRFLLIDLQCQVLHAKDFNPFWLDVWVWCKITVQFYFFTCGYPFIPNTICWRDYPLPTVQYWQICWKSINHICAG